MLHQVKHWYKLVVEFRYSDDISDVIRDSFLFESSEQAEERAAKILKVFPSADFFFSETIEVSINAWKHFNNEE